MRDFLRPLSERERSHRYPVSVATSATPGPSGLAFRTAAGPGLLPWDTVTRTLAAEVGEPEGVRTIVFDLLCAEGDGLRVLRLDAEPGIEAMELAQAIARHAPTHCQSASLKSVATDGRPSLWFPDLASLEEAALSERG